MYSQNILRCTGIAIFLGISSMLYCQIANIEKRRISDSATGWFGSAYLNFAGAKNTKSSINLSAGTMLEYKSKDSLDLWLLITDFGLISGEKEKFTDFGFGHLRYNHKFGPALRWEVFSQIQYNSLVKINRRALLGTGPRFKLTKYEDAKFYWGVAYMYEYEEVNDSTMLHQDHRISSYFTFTLTPEETVTFVSTTYAQPLLKDFGDFRILNETNLTLDISEKLSLNLSFRYAYDSTPPFEVPKNTYAFSNGILLEF